MKPIRPGDHGSAVVDIQRRLKALGYDLGRAGIDGLFRGATADAVTLFQEEQGITERGSIGHETWSALVDATFTLGDRMLYLRIPHLHGRDVHVLQEALNVLGFACGMVDGIFGAYTEHAVREFQRNGGLPADGIVGLETVRALLALRHVWEGKDPSSHSEARIAPARAFKVLAEKVFAIAGADDAGERIAARMVNLAQATCEDSLTVLLAAGDPAPVDAAVVMRICGDGTVSAPMGRPVVVMDAGPLAPRLLAAVSSINSKAPEVIVEIGGVVADDERREQSVAVTLLDALCVVLG